MRKKKILYLAGLIAAIAWSSCTGKKDMTDGTTDHASVREWKQMDDFHMIMAETFHPFKDSANLEPAKLRAPELLKAADEWLSAPLPAKMNNDEVKSKLRQLRAEAESLAGSVQSSDDNVIGGHLTKLHDTFHSIQEAWYRE